MTSIIFELQRDALDKSIEITDLLRKSYVVARKLKLNEFKLWVENELNGYKTEVPDYRITSGKVKAWNPYNGWIPITFEDPEEGEIYSKRACGQTIAELEHLVSQGDKNSQLHMPFPQNVQRRLCKGVGFETEVSLIVGQSALIKVLDAVRNIILNWALKLEEDGIVGDGLSFSESEKNNAENIPQNINNFYGAVHSPQIQQGNQVAIQFSSLTKENIDDISSFIVKLKNELASIDLDAVAQGELDSEIATVEAQINSPKPKPKIVKESMRSIRTVLEGASGSVAGQLLLEIGKTIFG